MSYLSYLDLPEGFKEPSIYPHLSWDGQIYTSCPECARETRQVQEFFLAEGPHHCPNCGEKKSEVVRHLEVRSLNCSSCDHGWEVHTTGFEPVDCPQCGSEDLTVTERRFDPPYPATFEQVLVAKDHPWGVDFQEDIQFIVNDLQPYSISFDADRYYILGARFCYRLRQENEYEAGGADSLRNIEANLLREAFRQGADLAAGTAALALFRENARAAKQTLQRALENHNIAMAIFSMLARFPEEEVVRQSGEPGIRHAGIEAARKALADIGEVDSRDWPEVDQQKARILHILGDLLRSGSPSLDELHQAIEYLDQAWDFTSSSPDLSGAIRASMEETYLAIDDLEQAALEAADGEDDEGDPGVISGEQGDVEVVYIPIEGDPEALAESLIADSLPKTFLDEIDISDDQGLSRLFACLVLRQDQASLEKDEILRFVERNRAALDGDRLNMLHLLGQVSGQVEGGGGAGKMIETFITQVEAALEGHPEKIDIKSDRLLWLLYAMGLQLSNGSLAYDQALAILKKPEHRARISPLSLEFMIRDYADTIGGTNQAPLEFLMLVSECALLIGYPSVASAGAKILSLSDPPRDVDALLDLLDRSHTFLLEAGLEVDELEAGIRRLRARFDTDIPDEDL